MLSSKYDNEIEIVRLESNLKINVSFSQMKYWAVRDREIEREREKERMGRTG